MKRAAVIVCAVLLLAACGGGGENPAIAQIKAAYTGFFTTKTSLADHVALMENGAQFKPLIQSFLGMPLAKGVSATVSSVTMQGANKAKVVYTVKIQGLSLANQTGYAVRQGGKWKVSDSTLCSLLARAGGPTPPACMSAADQIKAAYTSFFTTNTSVAARVPLLENGRRFKSVIEDVLGTSSAPVTVAKVTLQSPAKAKVVYSVKLSGMPLDDQTGYAVLQGGTWKVADATLCSLVSIDGLGAPAVCTS